VLTATQIAYARSVQREIKIARDDGWHVAAVVRVEIGDCDRLLFANRPGAWPPNGRRCDKEQFA